MDSKMKLQITESVTMTSKLLKIIRTHACLVLFVFFAIFFTYFANIDIWVSQLFYADLGVFPANDLWWAQIIYTGTPWVGRAGFLLTMLILLCAVFAPGKVSRRQWRRAAAVFIIIVLGIGILVNTVLKDGMGRPRPRDVLAFNGTTAYVPIFVPSQFCRSNCSFVSGHAAMGFALMSVGMFGIPRRRKFWMKAGLVAGFGIGLVRIAQGGHFLSDIVFAFMAIWMCHLVVRFTWLHFRLWQFRGRTRLLPQ